MIKYDKIERRLMDVTGIETPEKLRQWLEESKESIQKYFNEMTKESFLKDLEDANHYAYFKLKTKRKKRVEDETDASKKEGQA